MKRSNLFWGSAIVLLGAILLASNLNIIQGNVWVFFWPALVKALRRDGYCLSPVAASGSTELLQAFTGCRPEPG